MMMGKGKKTQQVCVGLALCLFPYASDRNQSLSFIILILSTLAHTHAYRIMYNELQKITEREEKSSHFF